MTATEYRICVSDTPENLASEVTQLLAQGWELYGYPFIGEQSKISLQAAAGGGNGNGHLATHPVETVCQAMVRLTTHKNGSSTAAAYAPVAAVSPALHPRKKEPKPPMVRQSRPPVPVSFRGVVLFLATLLAGFAFCETVLFRSGFYARFVEPEVSMTGSLERTFYDETHRRLTDKKEVLVIGNSRMAEGFSEKVANEYKQDGFHFNNVGVPGSGDRIWYYLVRDVDPHRDRYAAIAIPIDDYDDPDDYEDVADRASELPLVINHLRLTDIAPYTLSFTTWKSRLQVFRGLTLEGVVYQRDFQDFLEHPGERLQRVQDFREHGLEYGYGYQGLPHSLAGLHVDWTNHRVTLPPDFAEKPEAVADQLFRQPPQRGMIRAYEVRWLGALVDLYRDSKTRIVIFQVPRSPAPAPVARVHLPWTSIDELRKRSWVKVADRQTFEDMERPEWFADFAHLNAAGRTVFSPRLADLVKANLP